MAKRAMGTRMVPSRNKLRFHCYSVFICVCRNLLRSYREESILDYKSSKEKDS